MKKSFLSHTFVVAILSFVASAVTGFGAATFSVSPSIISNDFTGKLTFTMTGLTAGEAITIEQFTDFNSNKVVDGAELRVNCYRIADGQVRTIGGITNLNQLSDANAASTAITTSVEFLAMTEAGRSIGAYVFRFTGSNSGPTSVGFTNVNAPYAETITGTNKSGTTNIANTFVALLTASSDGGGNFFAGVPANASGVYSIKAPPGTYQVVGLRSNYVCSLDTAPLVTLATNATVVTNISLTPAPLVISGTIKDLSDSNANFPCVQMFVESSNNAATIAFTDTNGNFLIPVTSDIWKLQVSEKSLAALGYLSSQNSFKVNTTTGSVTSVTLSLTKGRSMIYGFIRDSMSNAIAGVPLFAGDSSNVFESSGISGASGAYSLAASPGDWSIGVDNSSPIASRYIFSSTNVTVPDLTAVRVDFSALPITGRLTGVVKTTNGVGIPNINIYAYANISGTDFNVNATTGGDGSYTLNLGDGSWFVGLDCYSLGMAGYDCSTNVMVTVPPSNHMADFIVPLLQPLRVTTTSLPSGMVGSFYNGNLTASGGVPNYNWAISSGSLPNGLDHDSFGDIFGTPTAVGTNNFTATVTDQFGSMASSNLSIVILPSSPLQLTTSFLPDGEQNCFYSQVIQATGGGPPYTFSLALGSAALPSGLTLSNNGTIYGTPLTNGLASFVVQVNDSIGGVASGTVQLFLDAAITVATTSLPNGTAGSFYSQQLFANGGNNPQTWSLVSGGLPPNLMLNTNTGVISGTPLSATTSNFTVRVADPCSAAMQMLSITIAVPLTLTTTSLPPAIVNTPYSAQLVASGGQLPYGWTFALGSGPLPAGLMLDPSGLISGMVTSTGSNAFIVQVNDNGGHQATRGLFILSEQKPVLDLPSPLSSNRFQFRLTGTAGQSYTVQFNTTLASNNWADLLSTNAPGSSFFVIDPGATNTNRIYRVRVN